LEGTLVSVAGGAVETRVDGHERKTCPVVDPEHLPLVRPRGRCVARLAAEAELAPVGVLVAVRAGDPHVIEDQRAVAVRAGDLLVCVEELEAGRVVTEGGRHVHRGPPLGVVALTAVRRQITMGIVLGLLRAEEQHGRERQAHDDYEGSYLHRTATSFPRSREGA